MHDSHGNTPYSSGAQRKNGTDCFFLSDWLGSTRHLTDSTGNAAPSSLRYDAYGNRSATTGTDPHPTDYQYAGGHGYEQEYADGTEPGLGLQLLGYRYYEPATGRFISRDPIRQAGGLNLYGYCGNNPVGAVDPLGLCPGGGSGGSWDEALDAFEDDVLRGYEQGAGQTVRQGAVLVRTGMDMAWGTPFAIASGIDNLRNGRLAAAGWDGLGILVGAARLRGVFSAADEVGGAAGGAGRAADELTLTLTPAGNPSRPRVNASQARQQLGAQAEEEFRAWLTGQGMVLRSKTGPFAGGPDAERVGGTDLGWGFAELKPNTPDQIRRGVEQINGRFGEGYQGPGGLYLWEEVPGGIQFWLKHLLEPELQF